MSHPTEVEPDIVRYRAAWQDEIDSATIYRAMAAAEKQPQLAQVYRRLAETEAAHIGFWEERLRAAGATVGARRPTWRARALGWLARRFGPQVVLPTIAGAERADSHRYDALPETQRTTLPSEERSHARLLRSISGGLEGSAVAQLEGRHRAIGGNALRAAVLGANDGLVSNLSLVMGVAGAALESRAVLITGLAGLLAGAGSMALGEWLSVQSSRELYQRQIAIEARELEEVPDEEAEELALIYQAKGLSEQEARALAGRLMANSDSALDTLSREELGIDPEELGGSAWEAAAFSFLLFAVGAIIPVIPFALFSGPAAIVLSLIISAIGLFVIGAGITLMTGRSVWFSGMRQVLFGLVAAALTFGIGRLIGVSLG
jgi:VIT1/CCC1 family predicted Fe2+/Mn2+ transporter